MWPARNGRRAFGQWRALWVEMMGGVVLPRRASGLGAQAQPDLRSMGRTWRQASTPKFFQQPLRYSAATGGDTLEELTLEEDSAEGASLGLVAPGALTSAS